MKIHSLYNEVTYFHFNMNKKIKEVQRGHRKHVFIYVCINVYTYTHKDICEHLVGYIHWPT